MQALDGLRAGYGDRLPGDKRPSDFADVVEHVASLRYALGSRLTGMRVLDHVVGDIVAQAVDLVLVAVLEHARKVRPASRLSKVSRRGDSKYVTCGNAPI